MSENIKLMTNEEQSKKGRIKEGGREGRREGGRDGGREGGREGGEGGREEGREGWRERRRKGRGGKSHYFTRSVLLLFK